jgi:AraC-like DNA-binding protein
MIREPEIIDQLSHSEEYQDFERAFCEITHLSLRLRPLQSWDGIGQNEWRDAHSISLSVVPVRVGDKAIGVLEMVRPERRSPSATYFQDLRQQVSDVGAGKNVEAIQAFPSVASSRPRYEAMAHLLEIFAKQLELFANQILIQQAETEPYRVRLVRAYTERHQAENLSLSEVARVIHVSPFYLCKIFKRATGLTFIDFRNRLRIESAKKLLTAPGVSISEIAYKVGFQSLTQFNRLFRRIVGKSPTEFRRAVLTQTRGRT